MDPCSTCTNILPPIRCAAPCAQTKPNGLGYAPGWCGVHVTQYQKNEGPNASNGNGGTSDYRLDVEIFDSNQFSIDKVTTQDAPAGQAVNVQGKLPGPLSVTAQNVDSDAVLFSYQGQNWAYAGKWFPPILAVPLSTISLV